MHSKNDDDNNDNANSDIGGYSNHSNDNSKSIHE